ncbi:hypothetical protein BN3087_660013 [Sulfurovum sp. enrichment culture clone C5]|uniref:Uncharacterized protein n=1 Tax=Sulfurovum sp. enrichment culture clone C5 TaxID=497650 RepID=A0A0S4XPD4_9BACT|nr:hypothetical protein BN3087_660013 [Sulfurovum sp. enrichment culture clone C5]
MVKYTKDKSGEGFIVSGLNINTLHDINNIINDNLKYLPYGYIFKVINSKKDVRNCLMKGTGCFTNHDLFLFIKELNNNPALITSVKLKIESFKKLTA